jgi:PGF-pre-PGF domain-containing protein
MKKYLGLLISLILLFSLNVFGTQYTVCSGGCDFNNITTGLENVTGTNNTIAIIESGNYLVTSLTTFYINDSSNSGGIYINEEDVAIDFGDINLSGAGTGYGIYIVSDNITISNCNIENYSIGIYFESTSSSYLTNNTISSSNWGIRLSSTNYTTIKDNIISNIAATALQFINTAVNNTFWNNQITSSTLDIDSSGTETSNTILNSSFDETSLNFDASAQLYVKWYFNTHLNDTNSNNVAGATINITDISSNLLYSLTTNGLGITSTQNITEYLANTAGYTYYSNFTFYAYNSSNHVNNTINISSSTTISLTFDLEPATITISTPTNNTNLSNSTTWTNVTITTDELTDCSYNLSNSGFDYTNEGIPTTDSADGLTHWFNYTGLTSNTTYSLYYKCNDSHDNINTESTHHTFYINQTPPDSTPAIITISNPTNNTNLSNSTTWINISIATDELADCSYNLSNSGFDYTNEGVAMADSGDGLAHWFNYTGLTDDTTYTLYYKCNDSLGNINTESTYHTFYINQTPPDSTPAIITISNPTNNTNLSNSTTWTNVTITTDELADCSYNLSNSGFDYTNEGVAMTNSGDGLAHWFNYTALTDDTTYTLYYKCNDSLGNINTESTHHTFYINQTPPDSTPAIITISNPTNNTDLSNNTAWVNVSITTNEQSSCHYNLSNTAFNYATQGVVMTSSGDGLAHWFNYTGLVSNSSYDLYYKCNDTTGNVNTNSKHHTFNINETLDTSAPIINTLLNTTTTTTIAISFNTNKNSNSSLKYGTSQSALSSTVNNVSFNNAFAISLSGLTSNTTYYFNITTCNTNGYCAEYGTYDITTDAVVDATAPVISNTANSSITNISATVTWTTDESSNSLVKYGTTSGTYTTSQTDATYITSHSESLTSLSPTTTYYYVVNSTDASGNSVQSSEYSFTTTDLTPPTLSSISSSSVTTSTATISWTSSESSDSQVIYGTTSNTYTLSSNDATSVTSHSISLSSLNDDTTYYYRVISNDSSGNTRQSIQYSFTTLDATPPVITFSYPVNMSTTVNNAVNMRLTVTTDEAATCYVDNHLIGSSIIATNINLIPADSNNLSHSKYFNATTESNSYNFYYTVVCTDADSNSGSKTVYFALDDTTAPTATFSSSSTSDDSYSSDTSETIQIVVSESMTSSYPKISFNGASNASMSQSGLTYTYTKTGLTDGVYNYSIYLSDIASNNRIYSRSFTTDTTEPEIDETYPEDDDEIKNCMGLILNLTLDEEGTCEYEFYIFEEEEYNECNDDCDEDKDDCDDDDDKTSTECGDELEICEDLCEDEKYDLEDEDTMEESEYLEDCQDSCEITQDTCEDTCETEDDTCTAAADDGDDRDDCDDDLDDCEEDCLNDKDECDIECEETYIYEADFSSKCLDDAEYLTVFTCEDLANNEIEENITFTINDISPPTIISSSPTGVITSTEPKLSLTTDENAICKFSTEKISYANMDESFGKSSTSHSHSLDNLENQEYIYYVLCNDTRGNVMTTHEEISFRVNSSSAPTSDSQSFSIIKSGETATFDIKKTDISIIKIQIGVNSDVNDATIDVKKIADLSNIKTYSKAVYQYLQITKEGISNKQINSAIIDFKIPLTWISSEKVDVDNIKLFKYTTSWEEVPTSKISQDSNFAYFQSTTTGFSLFAVSSKDAQTSTTTSSTPTDTTSNPDDSDEKQTTEAEEKKINTEEPIEILDEEKTGYFWLIIFLCVMVVGGGTAGFFVYKSHRHPQQNSDAVTHIQPTQTVAEDEQSTSDTAHPLATISTGNENDELSNYISVSIQNGQSIEEVSKSLIESGYTKEDVDSKLAEMGIIDELRDYINSALSAGQNLKEIKKTLIDSGYGPQDVINKFVDMKLDENQNPSEEVINYINEALSSGINILEIKQTLIEAGHAESDLNKIISNLNPEEINQKTNEIQNENTHQQENNNNQLNQSNKQESNETVHNEEINNQIINYMQDSLEYNMSENQIIQQLVEEGHDINHIRALMAHVLRTVKPKQKETIKPKVSKQTHIKQKSTKNLNPHEIAKKHTHKHDEVMDYIKNALIDKIPKRLIQSELIKSGHTKKEIKKRFVEIAAVEKKLKKDLKAYIKVEKKAGIKKTEIKNELLNAGIDKKLIKKLI